MPPHGSGTAALFAAPKPTPTPTPDPVESGLVDYVLNNGDKLMWFAITLTLIVGVAAFLAQRQIERRWNGSGMATRRQLRRSMTRAAIYKEAKATTPSLQVPRRLRRKIPLGQYAIYLGKASEFYLMPLYAAYRDIILLIGPPQTGKTALLGHWLIDVPGCMVTTSTKVDAYLQTREQRAKSGNVYLFNPKGLGGLLSDFRWNPIDGCQDPNVATERAAAMLHAAGQAEDVENAGFWTDLATDLLKCYMHAAALDNRSFREMWQWTQNPDNEMPLLILRGNKMAADGWDDAAEAILSMHERTVKSVLVTLRRALRFMTNESAAASVAPEPGMPAFDIDAFLTSSDALYLIGENEQSGSIAPLFACFTTALFSRAKELASFRAYGRHDPAVSFILDEAALICPIPLADWAADSGGRGIFVAMAVQSMAQIDQIYGAKRARALRDAANTLIVLPGLKDTSFTEEVSKLCGEHDVKVHGAENRDASGQTSSRSTSIRRERVMPVEKIREMRTNQALILRRNTRPVLVDYKPVWKRKELRAATTAYQAAAAAGFDPGEFQAPAPRKAGQQLVAVDADEWDRTDG